MESSPIRAPREDGGWLVYPDAFQAGSLIEANLQRFAAASPKARIFGLPIDEVRSRARQELVIEVTNYSRSIFADEMSFSPPQASSSRRELPEETRIIMSGHQPELFHPGVWFKNFLLSRLSMNHRAVGVNVVIDHDLAKRTEVVVPARNESGALVKHSVDFGDRWDRIPWQFSNLHDPSTFFRRAKELIEKLDALGLDGTWIEENIDPIQELLGRGCSLGAAFSRTRYRTERALGLTHFEIPFSQLSDFAAWRLFAAELFCRASEVNEVYNSIRDGYRREHRIKNEAQPFPPLGRMGEWIETPFWIYTDADPARRPLWVKRTFTGVVLSNAKNFFPLSELSMESSSTMESDWQNLRDAGWHIRPRALTTTMFLRLLMSDVFIHGIGGAVYDQLTDHIVHRLWSMSAPSYIVATATLRLPVPSDRFSDCGSQEIEFKLRDWRWTPERCFSADEQSSATWQDLVNRKRRWIQQKPSDAEVRLWHVQIQRLNQQLRELKPNFESEMLDELTRVKLSESEDRILTSREHSFAIFPLKYIAERLDALSHQAASVKASAGK